MSVKQNLINEFNSQIEEIGKMEVGTEQYKIAMDGLAKLSDRIIEYEKIEQADSENTFKWEAQNAEQDLKVLQMKQDHKDQIIRNCIEGAKVVGGFGLATWAFIKSMKFEETGTLTTEGGKAALRSLLKFMK